MSIINNFRYRPEIDGLRAISVLAVVLYHTGFGCSGGFVGVDVFFVISGFLITSLIWKDLENQNFTFANFWERRARRIIPALTVVTLATLIAGWFIMLPSDLEDLGTAASAQSIFGANFHYWQSTGYFLGAAEEKPLLHTWSLAVEEQFYFIVPVLFWGIFHFWFFRNRKPLVALLSVGFTLSFILSIYGVSRYPSASFYLLPTRAWELLLGAIVVFLPSLRLLRQLPSLAECVSISGLLLIVIPIFIYKPTTPFPGLAAFAPCVGAAIIIWSNKRSNELFPTRVGSFLAIRPLVFVGLISYSWYLWHWPILAFGKYLSMELEPHVTRFGFLIVGLICAIASWKYIETPFRKRIFGSSRKLMFGFSGTSIGLSLLLGLLYSYGDGFPKRVSARALTAAEAEFDMDFINDLDSGDVRSGKVVQIGARSSNEPPVLLVWGDSHAMAALPAVDDLLRERGLVGCAATHAATAPVFGWYLRNMYGLGEKSTNFNEAVFSYITSQGITTVLLHSSWSQYADGPNVLNTSFDEALLKTVRRLTDVDVKVYLMLDVPLHSVSIPRFLTRRFWEGDDKSVTVSLEIESSSANRFDRIDPVVIQKIKQLGAVVLDPKPLFRDHSSDNYKVYTDGEVLYRDSSHLTVSGAKLMLKPLLDQMLFEELSYFQDPAPSISEKNYTARRQVFEKVKMYNALPFNE